MTAYSLTEERIEKAAEALATTCNGGSWAVHYTPKQKKLWCDIVRKAMSYPYEY